MDSPTAAASPASTATIDNSPPKISIEISLTPTTYTFGSPPPTLTVTATNHASTPITVFTGSTILNPRIALSQKQFLTKDLTTGAPIKQKSIMVQRLPPCGHFGGRSDSEFLTLLPGEPLAISYPFGPQMYPCMAMSDPRRVQAEGRKPRRSMEVSGVDGLEGGREYLLVVSEYAYGCWWRWGTKEEVLAPAGKHVGLGDGDGEYVRFDVSEINQVRFFVESE